jgi:membrane protease YdiL (CAAX protease family)
MLRVGILSQLLAGILSQERALYVLAFFLCVSAGLWARLVARWQKGEPILPLARRRPVPWLGQDVLLVFFISLLIPMGMAGAVHSWLPANNGLPADDQKKELAHAAQQLLRTKEPAAVAVAAIMAIVVAPLIEEFLFRVLFQGWLEAVWSRRRKKHPELRLAPLSSIPVVLPAAIFAIMHLRFGKAALSPDVLLVGFLSQMAADLLVLALAIGFLRFAVGATAADLGWNVEMIPSDARLGGLALLIVTPPILAMNTGLTLLVNATGAMVAPDPIPLFVLALVFGTLYQRTHRLAPSLVLHMAFNATSIVLFFASP